MSLEEFVNDEIEISKKKNVVGIGIGEKHVNGIPTGEKSAVVLVQDKVPMSSLREKDRIPKTIDGFKTDVLRIGKVTTEGLTKKIRPLTPGYGCGHGKVTAGTIGGVFMMNGYPVILSNNHVLANTNSAKIGDTTINPAKHDGGSMWNPYHRFGNLKDFVVIKASDNYQDSAVSKLHQNVVWKNEIYRIGAPTGIAAPVVGTAVQKSGRTTGYTTGKIITIHAKVSVWYGNSVKKFNDCILTTDMSQGGDSGSLLLDMSNNIIGLLFAGSSEVTIYNDIKYPMQRYGLELINPPAKVITDVQSVSVTKNGQSVQGNFQSLKEAQEWASEALKSTEAADEYLIDTSVKVSKEE